MEIAKPCSPAETLLPTPWSAAFDGLQDDLAQVVHVAQGLNHLINTRLGELLSPAAGHGSQALTQAMRHAVLGPGKRIRPTLAVLVGRDCNAPAAAMLDAACALEIVHCASLVIDDLPAMDNAEQRRGRASTHAVHGVDVAMLAAIALLARAFAILSSLQGTAAPQRAKLVGLMAEAVGEAGLAGGQVSDLRCSSPSVLTADTYGRLCALKTGVLFDAAVNMAATLAAVSDARLQRLRQFSQHVGQAFQIADDLSDAHEDAAPTFVSLQGAAASRRLLRLHVDGALASLESRQGVLQGWLAALFAPAQRL